MSPREARPAADAGRADEALNLYEVGARALVLHGSLQPDSVSPWSREREINSWAQSPSLRAAADAVRAPLLAELERVYRLVDHWYREAQTRESERDEARATVYRINQMVDRWCDGASSHYPSRLIAEIEDELKTPPDPMTAGRDEAAAQVEVGGDDGSGTETTGKPASAPR